MKRLSYLFLFFMILTMPLVAMERVAEDEQSRRTAFLSKARELARQNGCQTGVDNVGKDTFAYIPDDKGQPFAILISGGDEGRIHSFTSEFARLYNLDNIRISAFLDDFFIRDRSEPFEGLVEEYCSVGTEFSLMPDDLSSFFLKYTKNNSFILSSYIDSAKQLKREEKSDPHRETFLKYLDIDSAHKFFAYVILMNDKGLDAKNIALQINEDNKLTMKVCDTKGTYADKVSDSWGSTSFICHLPFANDPISDTTREIIFSWKPQTLRAVAKCHPFFEDSKVKKWYRSQERRIADFQSYLKAHDKATPLDVMLFAFFKTIVRETGLYDEIITSTYGAHLLSSMGSSLMMDSSLLEAWRPEGYKDFGRFFYGGLTYYAQSYVTAMETYNMEPRESKTLHDFMRYILTLSYFKKGMGSEFKNYVKEKFGFEID